MNKYDYVVKSIRVNNFQYWDDNDSLNIKKNNVLVQFQDRVASKYISNIRPVKFTRSWCRIWIDNELVFNINDSKYVARDKAIKYLKGL